MQTVFVTGAAGFLGSHVSSLLAAKGHRIVGLGHGRPEVPGVFADWLEGTISKDLVSRAIAANGMPDVVYHLAGSASVGLSLADPCRDFERSASSTAALIYSLNSQAPDTTLVLASSAAVYGDHGTVDLKETDLRQPVSPYGIHKMLVEEMALHGHRRGWFRLAIVRFFSIYGIGLRKQLLWDAVRKSLAVKDAVCFDGTGDEVRDFIHVTDAAAMLAEAADRVGDAPLILNGASGNPLPISEVLRCLYRHLDTLDNCQARRIEFTGHRREGDPVSLRADVGALREMRMLPGNDLQEGLAEFGRWARESLMSPALAAK